MLQLLGRAQTNGQESSRHGVLSRVCAASAESSPKALGESPYAARVVDTAPAREAAAEMPAGAAVAMAAPVAVAAPAPLAEHVAPPAAPAVVAVEAAGPANVHDRIVARLRRNLLLARRRNRRLQKRLGELMVLVASLREPWGLWGRGLWGLTAGVARCHGV